MADTKLEQTTAISAPQAPEASLTVQVAGHQIRIFELAPPLIAAMVDDISQARQRVWLESYTIVEDAAGRAITAALKERAGKGVDCRVMYDALGCAGTSSAFFRDLTEAGVQVHAYHTLREALWRFSLFRVFNRRNHRKLLVVDDRVAYFGGMNIVDQSGIRSLEDVKARHLPPSAGWRDVHVRLEGPRQAEVAAAFDRLWQKVHGGPIQRWPRWPIRQMQSARGERIDFFDCRPRLKYRRATRVFVPLLRKARRSITVSMAYFIPQGKVLRELLRARRRGVKVRVIVPGQSDVKVVQRATRHMYVKLLKRGIRIYERMDQMLHSKALVIDGEWTVIGSCNLDPRSLWLNLEFCSVIRSRDMATAILRICRFELRHSRRVTLDDWHRRPWWQRLLDRTAWSFRRWL